MFSSFRWKFFIPNFWWGAGGYVFTSVKCEVLGARMQSAFNCTVIIMILIVL